MHPILVKFGSFAIYSWGAAFVLSFVAGLIVMVKRAARVGVSVDVLLELNIVVILAAIAGSRGWYVLNNLHQFEGRWLSTILPYSNGKIGFRGLAMNGGVVLVIVGVFLFARIRKINFITLMDLIAPSFLLAEGIQRLGGCFLNGCCFGLPTTSPLGIIFPPGAEAYKQFPGQALWPTQLFGSVLEFIGFALVPWLTRWFRTPGAALTLASLYYTLQRFVVDQFRYYPPAQLLGILGPFRFNTNHLILLGVVVFSLMIWQRGRKHDKN
jgi:phosphatidylglycerol:prolipoprotein diacylglycerol transferase